MLMLGNSAAMGSCANVSSREMVFQISACGPFSNLHFINHFCVLIVKFMPSHLMLGDQAIHDEPSYGKVAGCRCKFGESGARVFKLLAGAGQQLEQRTVSERAMLPIKTGRELLYRMLKARYISLQVTINTLLLLVSGPEFLKRPEPAVEHGQQLWQTPQLWGA